MQELSFRVKNADFVASVPCDAPLPETAWDEVCFIGRSNAGKSSLINLLTGQRKLARTSSRPGQTRYFNLFDVTYGVGTDASQPIHTLRLLDSPGYGYARVAKSERFSAERDILQPLLSRDSLKIVCLVIDARRQAQDDELRLQKLTFEHEKLLLVIATKVDTLNQREKRVALASLASSLRLHPEDLVLSGTNIPATSLWHRMLLPLHL